MKKLLISLLTLLICVLVSCNSGNSNENEYIEPKNYYESTQSIYGNVNGVWTKDKNPYIISGEIRIADHDTLIISERVQVVNCSEIVVEHGAVLLIKGTKEDPAIISWINDSTSNGCVGFIFLRGGSISSNNAIISTIINAIPVDDSMSINIEYTTMINSIIHIDYNGFWRVPTSEMIDSDDGYKSAIYTPRIRIKNSIVSTLANSIYDDTTYWIGFREGITKTDSISIDSSCIYDFTKRKKTKLFFVDYGAGDEFTDSIVPGDYNYLPDFVNYPINDGLDSGTYYVVNFYDVLNNVSDIDLRIKENTKCSSYGAYMSPNNR